MTLSPCRTLQNVIQTQKCVPCREYAKPNRCVFKCFAKVSKPKEDDLKSTGKAFHHKRSQTSVCPKNQHSCDSIPADHQHRHGPTNQNYELTPRDQRCTTETTLGTALNPAAHHNQEHRHSHNIRNRHLLTSPSQV